MSAPAIGSRWRERRGVRGVVVVVGGGHDDELGATVVVYRREHPLYAGGTGRTNRRTRMLGDFTQNFEVAP